MKWDPPLSEVHVSLLADQVGESAPHPLDRGEGVHDLVAPIHVGVQHTQNVLETVIGNQRLGLKGGQRRGGVHTVRGDADKAGLRCSLSVEDSSS